MEEKKEKRKIQFPQNKVVVGIGAIIFGFVICFVLTPIYNKSLKEKAEVVQMKEDIEEGTRITDKMIKVVQVGGYNLAGNVIRDKSQVIGKYAVTNIYKDEHLVTERISEKPLLKDEYLENLDTNKGAMSITLQTFASGVSGKLFENDIVKVIGTNDSTTVIPPELQYVKVLASTKKDGTDVDKSSQGEQKEDESTEEEVPDTVTLLVTDDQAKLLANMEVNQKIHLELVYRGKESMRNRYLKQQDKLLKEIREDKYGE